MNLLLVGLGALLLIVGVPVLVGLFLPERYTGRSARSFDVPPERLWQSLMDYESHPMTGRMARGFERLPDQDGMPAWTEDMGRGELITVKTRESVAPSRLVRDMASAAVPMTSRWVYDLEPDGGGCRLSIDGTTDIRRGTWHVPIFRFMMVVGGGVKKGLDIQLDMIAESVGSSRTQDTP